MSSATTSAGCSTTESKRERKVNFNDDELRVILDLFKTNAYILIGKFTPNITQKGKNRIWDRIAVATSACGYAVRSTNEDKKKWSDMKRTTIKIASEMKHPKTGGGPPQDRGWSTPCLGVVHPKTGGGPPQHRGGPPQDRGGPAIVQPWYMDTVLDILGD